MGEDQDDKYERATITGIRAARRARKQGIVADECQALYSNGQGRANAQAIDCQKPLVEMAATFQTRWEARAATEPPAPTLYKGAFRSNKV